MSKYYTDEKNVLLIIALLKANGISKVIASPGSTNLTFIASIQNDSFFEIYSAVDERSAAYMACGLAHESGESVVLSCTGATSSQNYTPGLIEAYYRKLPILAITSTQMVGKVGQLVPQLTDRSNMPKDTCRVSVELPIVKDDDDWWECEVKVNQAILELNRCGGGPVHINVPTRYSRSYNTKNLPACRVMKRFGAFDRFPELKGRVAVFIGAHRQFEQQELEVIERFCSANDAVVFCDHTSGYDGKYRLNYSLAASQDQLNASIHRPDITIHIGEVSGDYSATAIIGKEVWRVSDDGEIRDTFRKLRYVFDMDLKTFFEGYSDPSHTTSEQYLNQCQVYLEELKHQIPELPFSNVWVAQQTSHKIPNNSVIHFGILSSLRAWNFFELPRTVTSASNVGGFGIDGGLSSLVGASLSNLNKLYFGIIGDLAFFYDMNVMGNRHVGRNLRIMVVNNGKGAEFRRYNQHGALLGDQADEFICASGHFGNKSPTLIKHYSEDLGFEYISATNKKEFEQNCQKFISSEVGERPIMFEIFTDSNEESKALELIRNIAVDPSIATKKAVKKLIGTKAVKSLKKLIKS